MANINIGRILPIPKGDYSSATQYENLDIVYYEGDSYVAKQSTKGNAPTNTTYWQKLTEAHKDYTEIKRLVSDSIGSSTYYDLDTVGFINYNAQAGTNSDFRTTGYISCNVGDKFKYKLNTQSGAPFWVVFDADKNYLTLGTTTASVSDGGETKTGTLTIPTNGKYVVFNSNTRISDFYAVKVEDKVQDNKDSITSLSTSFNSYKTEVNNIIGGWQSYSFNIAGYINSADGAYREYTEGQGWHTTDYISVGEGTTVKYKSYSYGTYAIACYDSNKTFMKSVSVTTNDEDTAGTFTIPTGVYFIRCSCYLAKSTGYYLKVDKTKFAELKKELNEKINDTYSLTVKNDIVYKNFLREPFNFKGKKILFCGDSITRGYTNGSTTTTNGYPKLFSDLVGATFTNKGVGGACLTDTTSYGKIQDQIKAYNYEDFVFIAGGVNDWQVGIELSTFKSTMLSIVNYINSNYPQSTKVIFITPINEGGWGLTHTINPDDTLQAFRNVITNTVITNDTYKRFSVVQGNELIFPTQNDNSDYISKLYGDRLHPTELGYKVYSQSLYNILGCGNQSLIEDIKQQVNTVTSNLIQVPSNYTDITPTSHYKTDKYISAGVYGTIGAIMDYSGINIDRVQIPTTNNTRVTFTCSVSSNIIALAYFNDNDTFVKVIADANEGNVNVDIDVSSDVAKYVYICYSGTNTYKVKNYVPEIINVTNLKDDVESLSEDVNSNTENIVNLNSVLKSYIKNVQVKYYDCNINNDTMVNYGYYWAQSLKNNGGEKLVSVKYKASEAFENNKLLLFDENDTVTNIIDIPNATEGVNTATINTILQPNCKICILGCNMAADAISVEEFPDVRKYENANTAVIGQQLTSKQTISNRYRMSMELNLSYNILELPTSEDSITNRLKGKKIVGLGDSGMRGHSLAISQTWLAKIATRNGMRYSNYGRNGYPLTYCDLPNGYNKDGSVVAQLSQIDDDADIILIMAGANDAMQYNSVTMGTIDSTDNTTYLGALNYIIDYIHTNFPTAKLGFVSHFHFAEGVAVKYGEFLEKQKEVCQKHSVQILDQYNNSGINWNNAAQKAALRLNDNYHLNEAGMEYVSDHIEQFIRGL